MSYKFENQSVTPPQTVRQIEGLDSIVECGRAVVGGTRGVGQSVRVNSGLRSVLIVDIGGELSILGSFMTSASLPTSMSAVTALSLSWSISAHTTVGTTLLLLLGEFGVCLLVLHSAKLIGLRGLAATRRGAFLLEGESGHLDDTIQFQVLDLTRHSLTQNLSYDIHSRRE